MKPHMEDLACRVRNDFVVIVALAEAMETKVEDMGLGSDRTSSSVRDEDHLVSLAYSIANAARDLHSDIVDQLAAYDAEAQK